MNSTTPILSLTQPQRATLSWDGFINGDLGILDSYAGSVSSSISSLSGSIAGLSAFTLNGTTGSVSLVAGNNITLSQALSQITISAGSFSQSVQTQGSVLVNGSSGSIVFTAGTNITLSQNASTITIIEQLTFFFFFSSAYCSGFYVTYIGVFCSSYLDDMQFFRTR